MTVDQFVDIATSLKAAVEQRKIDTPTDSSKSEFKRSAPYGGCGLPNCRCSPGLWVSFFAGNRFAIAHFGTDYERGGGGLFDEFDFDRWRALCTEMHKHRVVEI